MLASSPTVVTYTPVRKRIRVRGRLTKSTRVAYWKAFSRVTRHWEFRWRAEMRQKFEDQRIQTIAKLRRWRNVKWGALPDESAIDALLLNHAEWNVVFAATGRRLGEAVVMNGGNGFLRDFHIAGVSFNVRTPGVREFLETRYGDPKSHLVGTWPQWINETTNAQLNGALTDEFRQQISESISRGESIDRMEERVEEVFGKRKSYQTQRIARTEVLGAHNNGTFTAMGESNTPGKEWIGSADERSRDSHLPEAEGGVDGQIRPIKEPFAVPARGLGIVYMMHPHAFGAPASETVSCRCSVAPVWSKEEIRAATAATV